MTIDWLFVFIGLVLLWMSFMYKSLLLSVATFLTWFGLLIWYFLAPVATSLLGITTDFYIYFTFVFFLLSIIPLVNSMNTSIRFEAQGQGRKMTWTEYGTAPKMNVAKNYETYKAELMGRTRRGKKKLRRW